MKTPKLERVYRLDSIPLNSTYFTDEGYLVDHPIVTSIGVFEYKTPDGGTRRELRLPEHVFKIESLSSYEGKPVIITHEAGYVDKDNVDQENIGTILSKGYRDGDNVRSKIVIHDTDAMKRTGLRELSLGYSLDLIEEAGVWNDQPYDAIQINIMVNHLAVVRKARAGEQARLNIDSKSDQSLILKGGKSMKRSKSTTQKYSNYRKDSLTPEQIQEAIAMYQSNKVAADSVVQEDPFGAVSDAQKVDNDPLDLTLEDPDAVPATKMDADEKVALVLDRRDRRDEGEFETLEEAIDVIVQQDEDIGSLLEVIDELKAKDDFDQSRAGDSDAPDHADNNDPDNAVNDPENTDNDDPEHGDSSDDNAKTMNADSVDRIISERLRLARIGDMLGMIGVERMKVRDAKISIVKKVSPNMRLDGKSTAYINAAFDMACTNINRRKSTVDQRKKMYRKDGFGATLPTGKSAAAEARDRMITRRENGGK